MTGFKAVVAAELEAAGKLLVQDGNHGEYRPRPSEFSDVGTTFVRAADMANGRLLFDKAGRINETALRRIRKGIGKPQDVILSHKGTVGKVAFADADCEPFVCSPQTTFWRSLDHEVIDPRYLFFAIRSPGFISQLRTIENESDMAAYVPLTQQRRLALSVPPIVEQRKIASILGVIDDKIAVNDRIATTADSLIKAKYERAVERESRLVALPSALRLTFGAPFRSSAFNTNTAGYPLIRIRDLTTFSPQIWTEERLPRDFLVETGETVIGMDAEFRPTFWLGDAGLLNQRVMHATSLIGGGPVFAREALRAPLANVESYKTGTTVAHLNKSDLERLEVQAPAASAMHALEEETMPLHGIIVELARQNRALVGIRETLLPELMSGRLRVRDAERLVEEAV
ncbi:restriction endonuclease subunit S [Micromonospora sp. NPDC049089]|uniref:restriction endonuclease subunit S n=1 Tax=Micromonospora sp. NPDC049089 TaxID=3155496 RepID=UPI0033E66C37